MTVSGIGHLIPAVDECLRKAEQAYESKLLGDEWVRASTRHSFQALIKLFQLYFGSFLKTVMDADMEGLEVEWKSSGRFVSVM